MLYLRLNLELSNLVDDRYIEDYNLAKSSEKHSEEIYTYKQIRLLLHL